ncbi:hypothetical protein ACVW0P_003126 [Mucilaginibacter sp. UYNi724]
MANRPAAKDKREAEDLTVFTFTAVNAREHFENTDYQRFKILEIYRLIKTPPKLL